MFYIDTNVLLSYVFISDRKHNIAKEILEKKIKNRPIHLSSLTIVEMKASLIRMIQGGYDLIDPLKILLQKFTKKDKVRILVAIILGFLKGKFNVSIASDDMFADSLYRLVNQNLPLSAENKIIYLFARALTLSSIVSLKTLDLLHLIYAEELKRRKVISSIVTFDKDFINGADTIRKNLKINIISQP
ncbi:MAG: type II toxin-antitoxin system VapC family toxin [Candidatus Njordarchaeum guaymaensis]